MYRCNQNLNTPVFHNIFTHRAKTKYVLRNENSIQETLCEQILVSMAYRTVDPNP